LKKVLALRTLTFVLTLPIGESIRGAADFDGSTFQANGFDEREIAVLFDPAMKY
jgi:hypothetical protein